MLAGYVSDESYAALADVPQACLAVADQQQQPAIGAEGGVVEGDRRRVAPRADGRHARPLGRVIQKEVRDPLTDEILFGKLEQGGTVTIGLQDDKLTFEFQSFNTEAQRTPI